MYFRFSALFFRSEDDDMFLLLAETPLRYFGDGHHSPDSSHVHGDYDLYDVLSHRGRDRTWETRYLPLSHSRLRRRGLHVEW